MILSQVYILLGCVPQRNITQHRDNSSLPPTSTIKTGDQIFDRTPGDLTTSRPTVLYGSSQTTASEISSSPTNSPANSPSAVTPSAVTPSAVTPSAFTPSAVTSSLLTLSLSVSKIASLDGNEPEILFCFEDGCLYSYHFPFSRPLPGEFNPTVETSYRYGSTQNGTREPHSGVEFVSSGGTPVIAAADGWVIFAGDDSDQVLGQFAGFYGNLVILEHNITGMVQPIFTLYAHLSKYNVDVGEALKTGQQLGEVGMTGSATGSHLHFEIRKGKNDLAHTINPELLLEPSYDPVSQRSNGTLVVRLNRSEDSLYSIKMLIQKMDENLIPLLPYLDAESYALHIPEDPYWRENLVIGDLAPGLYRVSFVRNDHIHSKNFRIEDERITLVEFEIE